MKAIKNLIKILLLSSIIFLYTKADTFPSIDSSKIENISQIINKNPNLMEKIDYHKNKSQTKEKNSITVTNDINSYQNSDKNLTKRSEKAIDRFDTPFKYLPNEKILQNIKSAQIDNRKQIPNLKRFSHKFFNNKNLLNIEEIPVPENYIISKGDEFSIWIYGAKNKKLVLKVDKNGNINFPQIGPISVGGKTFGEAKKILTDIINTSFKNSKSVIDLNSYSTIQVTLSGFVNAPGVYNLNSLARVKDLLIEAKGVSDNGSIREIFVKRDGKVVKKIDFYKLLVEGTDKDILLRNGDIVFVPKAKVLVKLYGAVEENTVFELKKGETLKDLLKYAGGLKPDANGNAIEIKRYYKNQGVKYITLSLRQNISLQNGDEIFIPKLSSLNENYVYIYGNVVYPGKKGIGQKNMKLSSFLNSLMKGKIENLFLENTFFDYAVIKRTNKDLSKKFFGINLRDILEQKKDFLLKSRDEIYIFNKLDMRMNPYVLIEGTPVFKPGLYQYMEGMSVKDLINIAGLNSPFDESKVKITSFNTTDKKPRVYVIDIKKKPYFKLKPFDEVFLFSYYETHPLQKATISGEVIKPGKYIIVENMTLKDLIENAGGLTPKAYTKECEIVRYFIEDGERKKKILKIDLKDADNFIIQNFDEINIHKIVNWNERKTVTLKGEFKFPGTYVIHDGEKLSSVIKRAGGFTKEAFLYGAVFTRKEIKKLQEKSLQKALLKLKEQIIMANMKIKENRSVNSDIVNNLHAIESLMKDAEKLSPIGRIAINLDKNITKFENSSNDLVLKDGDELIVPSFNDTVLVTGEVMNPTAITYNSKDVNYYLEKSGGLGELADAKQIFIIHANGETEKADIGSYLFKIRKAQIRKGDVIVVPKKILFENNMDIAKDITSILYKISLTVAAMHTVGAL